MTFQEYFADAKHRDWNSLEAAERLLRGIRKQSAQGKLLGICRVSHFILPPLEVERKRWRAEHRSWTIARWLDEDDEWDLHDPIENARFGVRARRHRCSKMSPARRAALQSALERLRPTVEPLERWEVVRQDVTPTPVPVDLWTPFDEIASDLTSHWRDDDEEPEAWQSVNWMAGTVQTFDMEWSDDLNVGHVEVEYTGLQITPNLANELLSYSDDELEVRSRDYSSAHQFRIAHQNDPKRGRTWRDLEDFWTERWNPGGKRGKKASPQRERGQKA